MSTKRTQSQISPGCRHGCLRCRSRTHKPWPLLVTYNFQQQREPSSCPHLSRRPCYSFVHVGSMISADPDTFRTYRSVLLETTKIFQSKLTIPPNISQLHTHFFRDCIISFDHAPPRDQPLLRHRYPRRPVGSSCTYSLSREGPCQSIA
jgi:hypothetical protein